MASNKKNKNKNKKTVNNNNTVNNNSGGVRKAGGPAAGLSSICDFLGGGERREEVREVQEVREEEWREVRKVKEEGGAVKPLTGKVKTLVPTEQVFRPSKVKKGGSEGVKEEGEEVKENRPTGEEFPTLGGAARGLGANFVRAEDKVFKPKVAPSQWTQAGAPPPGAPLKEGGAPPRPKGGKAPPGFSKPKASPPGFPPRQRAPHQYTPPPGFQVTSTTLHALTLAPDP